MHVHAYACLRYACRRLILIGDPKQLPATVFSSNAQKHNYEQSLFQRLQIAGQNVAMLTTQYRMHPQISHFPARRFYDGALLDAPNMAELRTAPWHSQRVLGPYTFFDVADGVASKADLSGKADVSWMNEMEALLALHIVSYMLEAYPADVKPSSFGIISPYNGQVLHTCVHMHVLASSRRTMGRCYTPQTAPRGSSPSP